MNGFGIADLVLVSWAPDLEIQESIEGFLATGAVTARAFECKINDWRSALTQAARYRYFAHQSIVVLPPGACERALQYLDTFRKTRIGLWQFDQEHGRIRVFHTPRATQPKAEKYLLHAVRMVHRAAKSVLPIA